MQGGKNRTMHQFKKWSQDKSHHETSSGMKEVLQMEAGKQSSDVARLMKSPCDISSGKYKRAVCMG